MMRLLEHDKYSLAETPDGAQILRLGITTYVVVRARRIGLLLVHTYILHRALRCLATGRYRLYEVFDEPNLADEQHLELNVGDYQWQGYLLPTGLPTRDKARSRFIPTEELISVANAVAIQIKQPEFIR
jgi:hypothetical protein